MEARFQAVFIMAAAMMLWACGGAHRAAAAGADAQTRLPLEAYRDHAKGGFVGQMAGVTYGAPYEFKFEGAMIPEWMMTPWSPGMIKGALIQDDIYVELTFLATIEKNGLDVSMQTIGREFGDSRYPLWHANKAARDLIRQGTEPPLSGHPRYNGHADDIDFQIEADLFGMICPGMTRAAQDIAWKFGHVMNYGDGVYGGVFMSAMYSQAFFETDRLALVKAGLAAIPPESNYARTIADVVAAYERDPGSWQSAWQVVEKNWAGKQHCPERHPLYPWRRQGIGANVNGAYVVIGLLYGEGEPVRTIKIATMCGRDADCNPASAMGILGTMLGFERLPAELKKDLPGMAGRKFIFTDYDWESALAEIEQQAVTMIEMQGGEMEQGPDGEVMVIQTSGPRTLPLEQWAYDEPGSEVPLPE